MFRRLGKGGLLCGLLGLQMLMVASAYAVEGLGFVNSAQDILKMERETQAQVDRDKTGLGVVTFCQCATGRLAYYQGYEVDFAATYRWSSYVEQIAREDGGCLGIPRRTVFFPRVRR